MKFVSGTRIFARHAPDGRQVLIYSMSVGAPEDLAMILPLPVIRGAGEDALEFVNLQQYPEFFDHMERGFPGRYMSLGNSRGSPESKTLKVVKVGNFVASFVPRVADFERLDARFRLPEGVWAKLGTYAEYGFAVFQLKSGQARIHPMAFTFPTALPGRQFFPTVHIHDGKVHPQAGFDHLLYCQVTKSGQRNVSDWRESELPASRFMDLKQARDLIIGDRHVFRHAMSGKLPNEDTVLSAA